MPPLGECFFLVGLAAVAILTQFGGVGADLAQGTASLCNYAFQMLVEHSRRSESYTLPKQLLPALKRSLFYLNMVASTDNPIDDAPVQALAMRCQLALSRGKLAAGFKVAATCLPGEAPLLHTPLCIIVLWVVGPTLPLHLALQTPLFASIWLQLFTEREELRRGMVWEDCERRGADVQSKAVGPWLVLGFNVGFPFQCQLHEIVVARVLGPLRMLARCLAPNETDKLDALLEPMTDNRIFPVNEGRDMILLPKHPARAATSSLLQ